MKRIDTKPNLNSDNFEQNSTDSLRLSGTTQIVNNFEIISGGTFQLSDGNEQKEAILTSNELGIASWTPNTFPFGLEGNVYFIDTDNTRSTEPDFTVKNAIVVENEEEFNTMTGISFSFQEVFDTWYMFAHMSRSESYFNTYYLGQTYSRTPDSIIGEGTTATVTLQRHGFKTGYNITISGAGQSEYNGTFSITVTGLDTFTYTTNSTISQSPATGSLSVSITYTDYEQSPPLSPPRFPAADPLGEYPVTTEQILNNDGLWGYDDNLDAIFCTTNWGIITGFASIDRYDNYVLEVDASSTAHDNDSLGVVMAFYIDPETGFEYTLSVYRNYDIARSSSGAYRIQYNYGQNGYTEYSASTQQAILDGSNLVTQSGQQWSEAGKTKFYIRREDDVFTVMIGQQGSNSYDTGTTLTFDLKDYSFLNRFRGPSKIGFLSWSQPDSYFSNLQFTGFGDYIFYNKNTYHDTWKYDYDTSSWEFQYPQITTLGDYVGIGRIVNSENFGKIYYTNHDGLIKKLANGGGTGDTVNISAIAPLNVIDGVVQFDYLSGNTYLGDNALLNVTGGTGSNNVALGYNALNTNINGSNNIALGYNAGSLETGSNKIYIGYGDSSGNTLIYGDSSAQTLKINGSLSIVDGTQLDEAILTSDEFGNASWTPNNFPIGLEGNVYFIDRNNTRSTEPDFTVKNAVVVETDKEFNTATGDTYTFEEIFNTWTLFSHFFPSDTYTYADPTSYSPTNFPALDPNNPSFPLTQQDFDNGDFWRYEPTTDSIILNQNYNPYTGYISDKYYDNYNLEVRLSSTHWDDDLITVIIAFYTDPETGFEYTLSAIRQPGGSGLLPRWGIVYNYLQNMTGTSYSHYNPLYSGSTMEIITGMTIAGDNITKQNWNTNGDTKIRVIRSGDTIIIKSCAFTTGTPTIDEATTIIIDLADYDVLEKFRGPSRIGFAAQSQQDATFSELEFSGFGNYIFYNKETYHDTWEYDYDTLTWSLQSPQTLTLQDYVGIGRIINSDKFGKLYYTKHNGIIDKLAAGGSTGSTGGGGDTSKIITQINHGFAVKDVIGLSGGTYNKAIANETYDGEILGIVSEVLSVDEFRLTQAGYVDGLSGLFPDTTYFLSDSTYGLLTSTEPTAINSISKTVLIAESETTAWVLPYVGYYILSGGTDGGLQPYSSLVSGSTVIWDASTGLNKDLTIGSDFTLALINLSNGMSGDLRLNITNTTSITLPPSYLNGNVTSLSSGVYHLAFVYNGTHIDFNIARYDSGGTSTGFVPDVNTGTVTLFSSTSMVVTNNTLVSSGDDAVTEHGTIYTQFLPISGDFSKGDFAVDCTSNGGAPLGSLWNDTLSGLIEGNTYYYKAYAINSFGIDEGTMKNAIPTGSTPTTYDIDIELIWNDTRSDSNDGLAGTVKLLTGATQVDIDLIPASVGGKIPKTHIIQWTGDVGTSYTVNLASVQSVIDNALQGSTDIWWRIGNTGGFTNNDIVPVNGDALITVLVDAGSPYIIPFFE